MRTPAASLALLLLSCFQPELISGRFRCEQPADTCPKQFVCHGGLCVDPALVHDGGGMTDLSGSEDLRGQDPKVDMRVPQPDMRPPCVQVSKEMSRDALACRITFAGGATNALCPGGYKLCGAGDDALLAKVEDGTMGNTKCSALGGFYASGLTVAVNKDPNKQDEVVCDAKMEEGGWALVGCGTGGRALKNDCKKLKVMMPCAEPAQGWMCGTGISDASFAGPEGGVLCCKE